MVTKYIVFAVFLLYYVSGFDNEGEALDVGYRFGLGLCSLSAANDDDSTFREGLLPLFLLGVFVFLFLKIF